MPNFAAVEISTDAKAVRRAERQVRAVQSLQAEERLALAVAGLPDMLGFNPPCALLTREASTIVEDYLHKTGLLEADVALERVRVGTTDAWYGATRGFPATGSLVRLDLLFPEIEQVKQDLRPVEEPIVMVGFSQRRSPARIICAQATFEFYDWDTEHPMMSAKEQAEGRMDRTRERFGQAKETHELIELFNEVSGQIEQGRAERGVKPLRDESRYYERMRRQRLRRRNRFAIF